MTTLKIKLTRLGLDVAIVAEALRIADVLGGEAELWATVDRMTDSDDDEYDYDWTSEDERQREGVRWLVERWLAVEAEH